MATHNETSDGSSAPIVSIPMEASHSSGGSTAQSQLGSAQPSRGIVADSERPSISFTQMVIDNICQGLRVCNDNITLQQVQQHEGQNFAKKALYSRHRELLDESEKTLARLRPFFGHSFETSVAQGSEEDLIPELQDPTRTVSSLMLLSNALKMYMIPKPHKPNSRERSNPLLRLGEGPQFWDVISKAESVLRKAAGMENYTVGNDHIGDFHRLSQGIYPWLASHTSQYIAGLLSVPAMAYSQETDPSRLEQLKEQAEMLRHLEFATGVPHTWVDPSGTHPDVLRQAVSREAARCQFLKAQQITAFDASEGTSSDAAMKWAALTAHLQDKADLDFWLTQFGSHVESGYMHQDVFSSHIKARSYHGEMASAAMKTIEPMTNEQRALGGDKLETFLHHARALKEAIEGEASREGGDESRSQ